MTKQKKSSAEHIVLTGALVLSTGKEVPVCVVLLASGLTKNDTSELEASVLKLHDLTVAAP